MALISVIVTTKDRADALDLVLRSLARQTDVDFEVVVADDGSGLDTAQVVTRWTSRLPVSLAHVWHAKHGLAEIRNRAIRASAGDYLVFLEGDCLTRPGFVATHRRLAEPGCFVTGNRILLSHELTTRVLEDGLELERHGLANWLDKRSRSRAAGRFSPLSALRTFVRRLPAGPSVMRGSNMAFWRADLVTVDGFDAAYAGVETETEIFVRLLRAGVRRKEAGFASAVLHLWHPEAERTSSSDPIDTVLGGGRIRAKCGLTALEHFPAKWTPVRRRKCDQI